MSLEDQINEDMDLIFDTDGLAVSGFWKSDGEDAVSINGIFDSTIKLSSGGTIGMVKADSYSFIFICKSKDGKRIKKDDSITIEEKEYLVSVDPIPTYGFIQIILNEAY